MYLRCFFRPHGYFLSLNARLPFKYLQTLARMSFTEYTRHMYIFPKGVRVRVDLPLNSSRVFVAPIVITKIERNTREGSVYIFDESI